MEKIKPYLKGIINYYKYSIDELMDEIQKYTSGEIFEEVKNMLLYHRTASDINDMRYYIHFGDYHQRKAAGYYFNNIDKYEDE